MCWMFVSTIQIDDICWNPLDLVRLISRNYDKTIQSSSTRSCGASIARNDHSAIGQCCLKIRQWYRLIASFLEVFRVWCDWINSQSQVIRRQAQSEKQDWAVRTSSSSNPGVPCFGPCKFRAWAQMLHMSTLAHFDCNCRLHWLNWNLLNVWLGANSLDSLKTLFFSGVDLCRLASLWWTDISETGNGDGWVQCARAGEQNMKNRPFVAMLWMMCRRHICSFGGWMHYLNC